MERIKVVIWDLDETFWTGTLTEGEIEYSARNHNIVRELARRGILSTLCSKNDHDAVRAVLERHGIWDTFVFSSVDWRPKGPRILHMLKAMKLRAENALFIDDNPMNLEEARFYSPGLEVASPEILEELLDSPALHGKPDPDRSRWAHYKLLERKFHERAKGGDNEEFLRQSGIVVRLSAEPLREVDRILELIERTNQLNYTKKRITRDELIHLLEDPEVEAGTLTAQDRYGDYGTCAFYALRHGALLHFLFSCRILDMGIERWLFEKLGRPSLEVMGEVTTPLGDGQRRTVDWICEEVAGSPDDEDRVERLPPDLKRKPKVLLKGGCDLEQVKALLGRDHLFETEFNEVTEAGVPMHREHTEILRCSPEVPSKFWDEPIAQLPFLGRRAFETRFWDRAHDAYVYSPLMDYTQGLYRYRDSELVIPYGDFLVDITDPTHWPRLAEKSASTGLTPELLAWFSREFRYEGCISPDRFGENLRWICRRIPDRTPVVFLNGSEVPLAHPIERDRWRHHQRMNAVVDEVIAVIPHATLCDVRPLVTSSRDVTNTIRHYRRRVYHALAEDIREIIAEALPVRFNRVGDRLRRTREIVKGGLRKLVR